MQPDLGSYLESVNKEVGSHAKMESKNEGLMGGTVPFENRLIQTL